MRVFLPGPLSLSHTLSLFLLSLPAGFMVFFAGSDKTIVFLSQHDKHNNKILPLPQANLYRFETDDSVSPFKLLLFTPKTNCKNSLYNGPGKTLIARKITGPERICYS